MVETETATLSRRMKPGDLSLAPHRIVGAQLLDGLDQRQTHCSRRGGRDLGSGHRAQRCCAACETPIAA